MEKHIPIARRIIAVETMAARVEGALAADEDLARLWRTEVALLEAAATVGLEGERISPSGMVMRLVRASAIEEETRASEMARRILAVAKRPGDILRSPVEGIRRIEAASASLGAPRRQEDILDDEELELVVRSAFDWLDMPILAGWRAAAAYAHRSGRESPAAERLIFLCVEGGARASGRSFLRHRGQDLDDEMDEVVLTAEASWVLAPSLALTRTGFRIWAPLTGLDDFIDASARSLKHDLGQLPILRRELAQLEQASSGARGRSRMVDLVAYLKLQPVVNSAMIVERLGVTRKTALTLLRELEDSGCLVNFTTRRVARFWSLPSLGRLMTGMARPIDGAGAAAPSRDIQSRVHHECLPLNARRLRDDFDGGNLERIMSEIDDAVHGIDELLGRAKRDRLPARRADP